jgi:type I restriction-modification system DNA methylase subunit
VLELIERFESNKEAYRSGAYNETQLRREFLDPFFKALGWDVFNEQGYAEAYKDVIHEDAIKIGGWTKAPDYCFRIGGARKFFVEAKKPAVNIKEDINPAFQLRRYAWSAKLPLSILTDFEEFAVYDCSAKPQKTDKASMGRTLYLNYTDYVNRWDELVSIFSREAVLKGSFDKYADSTKAKRGTADVDSAFLKEIENWRDLLARNIALRNPKLTQRELNFAVQVTIDRIIFLRICEDRGIEEYGNLMKLLNGVNIYARLQQLFIKADDRYNSGLFHFKDEKSRSETPDNLTPNLTIDDRVLKEIFKGLYYPESPYEFSVLPADILGQVYEQFLGKVIRLTAGGMAKVEEKPEVKKAGGVYYTPTYIVDYIVKNTVGKLLEGKNPNQVSKLKILDPACGSGSFLIGAYQYLIDWHRDFYANDKTAKHAKHIYQSKSGEWRLTTAEKKRILLNNIYGVDIDSQAVEVTKLSLLLKVLEGESEESLNAQFRLFHERALPDLSDNIKCGNSLIGPDFYDNQQFSLFDDEERYRINVFDWESEFSEIMKSGGFDTVIGNPPYIRIQALKEWAPKEVEFYKTKYISASKGNYDIYVVFVEKGLSLLNSKGRLGFILPHKFFHADYGEPLRNLITEGQHLFDVIHFGNQQVFNGATTYTCLLFLGKNQSKEVMFSAISNISEWLQKDKESKKLFPATELTAKNWFFLEENEAGLFKKLAASPHTLNRRVEKIYQGLATSSDKVYVLDIVTKNDKYFTLFSHSLNQEVQIETYLLHPLLKGSEIARYKESVYKYVVLFPYSLKWGKAIPLSEKELQGYPLAFEYLKRNKALLINRSKVDFKNWWLFPYPKNLALYETPKILSQVLSTRGNFTLDENGKFYFLGGGTAGGNALTVKNNDLSKLKFILGILNSQLTTIYVHHTGSSFRGNFFAFGKSSLKNMPIPEYNDKEFEFLVNVVDQMLELHKQLAATKTSHEQNIIQRQIDATDKQIDQLVYELYELTDEEIKIVEESTG